MSELKQYIRSYFGIDSTELEKIQDLFKPTHLNKGEFFTEAGKFCNKFSFIKSGYLRIYRYSDGNDVTQWISAPGSFVTDLSSLVFDTPSRWNIQALKDCELYTISKSEYQKIGKIVSNWDELEKLFLSKCFITLEDRVFTFLSMTAEERYNHLFEYDKELFNQIPLHFIASMLGMTPETLSRIRRKVIS